MTGWPSLYSSTDFAFYLIVGISVVLLVGVMATLLFFVFRDSHKRHPTAVNIEGNLLPEQEFATWYQSSATEPEPSSPSAVGEKLVRDKGCIACHSTDGTAKIGPTFKGLWGKKETVLHDGSEVEMTVDSAYVKQKLFEPGEARVKGYPPIMPSQKGVVTEQESDTIIEYLKSLQ